jgi:hypothetical protein
VCIKLHLQILALLVPFGLALACGDDDGGVEDAAADVRPDATDTSARPDTSAAILETLSYTPTDCDYEVSVPEVVEARPSGEVLGSDPTPRFIHASFAGPTDTSFAVNWQTDIATTTSLVLIGTDAEEVRMADAASATVAAVEGHHVLFRDLTRVEHRIHETHVCGLTPATSYAYKVGGPGGWSDVYTIATGPVLGATDSYRFAVSGDSRNDSVIWAETQEAIGTGAVDFQVFTGDAVGIGVDQSAWQDFFGQEIGDFAVQDVLAVTPFMVANGNHESLAINYLLQFALPQDESPMETEAARGEEWYSFDYGNAHFVALNDSVRDEIYLEAQRDWLREDLTDVDRATTPWIFVFHHRSIYSCSTSHGSQLDIRELWQPVYDELEVDLVFNGHDHIYERSRPIRGFEAGTTDPAFAAEGAEGTPVDQSGTVYVVSGGAGAPLYGSETCPHTRVNESTNNYAIIDIDGTTLRLVAYRLDGSVLDQFTYTKAM